MKKDFSIECAKSYVSNEGDEASLRALSSTVGKLKNEGKSYSITLLVDDASYKDRAYDFDRYASWLQAGGYPGVAVFRESQIAEACDTVLDMIDVTRLNQSIVQGLESENKYTSQLFITSWCLLRLGCLDLKIFPKNLKAERLINILPASFEPGENDSLDIIRATPYASAIDKIEYQFIAD